MKHVTTFVILLGRMLTDQKMVYPSPLEIALPTYTRNSRTEARGRLQGLAILCIILAIELYNIVWWRWALDYIMSWVGTNDGAEELDRIMQLDES